MISRCNLLIFGLSIVAVAGIVAWIANGTQWPLTTTTNCNTAHNVTNDWKIFRSDELGYTLFYPSDWRRTSPTGSIGHEMDFHAPDEDPLTTSFAIVKDTRSWEQIRMLYNEQWSREFPGMMPTGVMIGGLHGTRYDYPKADNSDIYLLRGDDVLNIVISSRSSLTTQEILRNVRFDAAN